MLKEPRMRERFLTREEAVRLLRKLPAHIRPGAGFAVETGLRMREILACSGSTSTSLRLVVLARGSCPRHMAWGASWTPS
jgi:hypothetical protein